MNRLTDRAAAVLRRKSALWGLFFLSAGEATVIPIPLEVVLIPFMAANRARIWRIASVTLGGCLLGALAGYFIGLVLFQSLGTWFIESFGFEASYDRFLDLFKSQGFWAILLVGVLPIPFQVAMLAAGAAAYPLALFLLASAIARGIRYYGLAWLVARYGDMAARRWRTHSLRTGIVAALVIVAIMAGWQLLQAQLTG